MYIFHSHRRQTCETKETRDSRGTTTTIVCQIVRTGWRNHGMDCGFESTHYRIARSGPNLQALGGPEPGALGGCHRQSLCNIRQDDKHSGELRHGLGLTPEITDIANLSFLFATSVSQKRNSSSAAGDPEAVVIHDR